MQNSGVTVIMNVRNGERFLREAIESVIAQTWTDWQLIIWDDCSTDSTLAIAREYRDSRIECHLSPVDTPLGPARESALALAAEEWVAFLDQDDIWMPRKLEQQMAVAAAHPRAGLVYGRTVSFFENGVQVDYDHRHEFERLPEGNIFGTLFRDSCFIAISSALFRKSALLKAMPLPQKIHVSPDYYLFLAVARTEEVRAVQDIVCRYRWHGNNMTFSVSSRIHEECLWLLDLWKEDIDPPLARQRRKVHQTLIAVDELRRSADRAKGLRRLYQGGSLPYLLSRPFARTWRMLRRKFLKPVWTGLPAAGGLR